jgi:hypothetical protein
MTYPYPLKRRGLYKPVGKLTHREKAHELQLDLA